MTCFFVLFTFNIYTYIYIYFLEIIFRKKKTLDNQLRKKQLDFLEAHLSTMLAPQIGSSPQVRVNIQSIFQTPTVLEVPLTPNTNFTIKNRPKWEFFSQKDKILPNKNSSFIFSIQIPSQIQS